MSDRIIRAVLRCRPFALSVFLTYVLSSSVGILMAHAGNRIALEQRDRIVGAVVRTDKAAQGYQSGRKGAAAVLDCAGNLLYAAIPQTVAGLGVVLPYFSVTYQGWVGGIVSVDGSHASRFRSVKATSYYFIVLLLQFIPFSLSIGAGIRCGVDCYGHNAGVGWRIWRYRIPRRNLIDLGCVVAVAVPLFLGASAFEFLSSWNA
jgi:hypothetical protein